MTKRELIDEIVALNDTAKPELLLRFEADQLDAYRHRLLSIRTRRLVGDPRRFDRYFVGHGSSGARPAATATPEPPDSVVQAERDALLKAPPPAEGNPPAAESRPSAPEPTVAQAVPADIPAAEAPATREEAAEAAIQDIPEDDGEFASASEDCDDTQLDREPADDCDAEPSQAAPPASLPTARPALPPPPSRWRQSQPEPVAASVAAIPVQKAPDAEDDGSWLF